MEYDSEMIFHTSETTVFTISVARAVSLPQRMRGLLGRPPPPKNCALHIERCGSVHTIGMRYPIDLVFLDQKRCITRIVPNVPPNRLFIFGGWRAKSVLEFASGGFSPGLLRPGMRGEWQYGAL